MSLFDRGDDSFKAGIHGLACALAGASAVVHLEMAYYNRRVHAHRGARWHRTCAVIYACVTALEVVQVARHLREGA